MREFIKSIEGNVLEGQNLGVEDAMKLVAIEAREDIALLCNSADKKMVSELKLKVRKND
jgi:biotin synthase